MKLNFTRKTWYFFLLASAAVSMLNGLCRPEPAPDVRPAWSRSRSVVAGIAALFLAAEKSAPQARDKRNYLLGVFVLLLVSYMVNGWAGLPLLGAGVARPAARH